MSGVVEAVDPAVVVGADAGAEVEAGAVVRTVVGEDAFALLVEHAAKTTAQRERALAAARRRRRITAKRYDTGGQREVTARR